MFFSQLIQIRLLPTLALLMIILVSTSNADERGNIELGVDASFEAEFLLDDSEPLSEAEDRRAFHFEVPSRVRIGFFPSPKTSLEMAVSFSSGESATSSVRSSAYGISLFHHFVREQFAITPYLGLTTLLISRDEGDDILREQFAVGLAAGFKSSRTKVSPRFDLALYRRFKGDGFPASTIIVISGGFSVFTGPAPN
ncbi:MAG: hypothetical protein IIB00_03190 [candidate division Zixibacteria bacterium]|nr:hypothetical protein [candidate division Zixibacteria bacterium]